MQCRKARWASLLESPLLEDNDRRLPPPEVQAPRAPTGPLPNSLFDCDTTDFSLGMDKLRSMSTDTSLPSPNAESWRAIAFAMEAWFRNGSDWMKTRQCFLSLLLRPFDGIVFKRCDQKQAYIVTYTCKLGFLAWPLQRIKSGTMSYFLPQSATTENRIPWKVMSLDALNTATIFELAARPPCSHSGHCNVQSPPRGVILQMVGASRSPLRHGAENGFTGMTVPMLADLVDIAGASMEGKAKPSNDAGLLHLLYKYAMPEKSAEEIAALVARRSNRKLGEHDFVESDLLQNLEAGGEVFDQVDMPDLASQDERHIAGRRREEGGRPHTGD